MGGSLLHVHAAQQCRRGSAGTAELPAALLAHPLSFLHQPLTRGHRLAELSLRCYSPDWLWEETQLLGLRQVGGGQRWRRQVNGWKGEKRKRDDEDEAPGLTRIHLWLVHIEISGNLGKDLPTML